MTKTQQRLRAATGNTPRQIRAQARTSNSAVLHHLKSQGKSPRQKKRTIH